MTRPPAFVTDRLPVLYTIHPIVRSAGMPTLATVDLAVVTAAGPSFLAPYTMPEDQLDGVVASLQSGDVRVAVTGVELPASGTAPMAYVSVVCADGRRLAVARLRGSEGQSGADYAQTLSERVTAGQPLNVPQTPGCDGDSRDVDESDTMVDESDLDSAPGSDGHDDRGSP